MGRYPQRGGTDIRKKSNLEAIAVAEKTTGTDLMDGFIRGTTTNPDGTPISSSKYSPGVRVPPMMF